MGVTTKPPRPATAPDVAYNRGDNTRYYAGGDQ